jgi:hypothetical protein
LIGSGDETKWGIKKSYNVGRERLKTQLISAILDHITNAKSSLPDRKVQETLCRKTDTEVSKRPETLLSIENTKYVMVAKFVAVLVCLNELGYFGNVSG